MKKLLAYILAATVFSAYAIPSYAATGDGWSEHYEEPTTTSNHIDTTTEYMEVITSDESDFYATEVSGKVLHIKFARESVQANTYLYVENGLSVALTTNTRYKFSFYAKGIDVPSAISVGIGTSTKMISLPNFSGSGWTITDKGNGWSLYEYSPSSFKYDGTGSHFRIKVQGKNADIYIDNVSLKKYSGSTDELIIDGGFENTNITRPGTGGGGGSGSGGGGDPDPDPDPGPAPDPIAGIAGTSEAFAPKNVLLNGRSVADENPNILLSWQNPANLTKLSVYDITSGKEVKLGDVSTIGADVRVTYNIERHNGEVLDTKKIYTYKIVCEFTDTKTETIVSGRPQRHSYVPETSVTFNNKCNHPGNMIFEHDDIHQADYSNPTPGGAVRVISNRQSEESENYIKIDTKTISFTKGKRYEVSAWMKGERYGVKMNAETDDNWRKNALKFGSKKFETSECVETDANGWGKFVYTFTAGVNDYPTSGTLVIEAQRRTDLLVDDIEVWEIDDDGNHVGDAKFWNYFDGDINKVEKVTGVTYAVSRNSAIINYTAPKFENAIGWEKVRLYVKDGNGNLSKRAEVLAEPEKDGQFEFSRLTNDCNYTFVLKAVDDYNNESEGVEITLTPTPDDYECFDFGLYEGEILKTELESGKSYTVKARVKNNRKDSLTAQIVAFLREKDGERFVKYNAAASAVKNVEERPYNQFPVLEDGLTQVSATISTVGIDSSKEYELTVYLWDGLGTMTILTPCKTYKQATEE